MNSAAEKYLLRFIRQITTAAANASLYELEHPQVLKLCLQAREDLQPLFGEFLEFSLKLIDNQLIFADHPVSSNLAIERLIEALTQRGISYLQILPGVDSEELLNLINTLSKRPENQSEPKKSQHISYGRVEVRYRKSEQHPGQTGVLTNLTEVTALERDKLLEIYRSVHKTKQLNVVGLSEIVGSFVNAFSNHAEAFLALAPLRAMDEYTYTHSTNICLLNLTQAKLLGIEGPLLSEIGIAAMLHDVGKMFISPDILNKPGALDPDEWEIMQKHPQLGAEYLLNTPGVPRLAVITAYEHHMRYDGKGYPKTDRPWHQNLCSYMTTISDFYDALRTRRSYRESLTLDQISAIMLENAGTTLHPELTHSFLNTVNKLESES